MSSSVSSISEPSQAIRPEEVVGQDAHGAAPCPLCGQTGAREWLQGPDRFHGRKERYTLVRCPGCSLAR